MTQTFAQLLRTTTARLAAQGIDTAMLDASLLVQKAAGCTRLELVLNADDFVPAAAQARLEALVKRREQYEPVAYILEEQEFWGLPFKVRAGVLIPRPDTETLVATVLGLVPADQPVTFADIGVGSGCITLSLLHELPQAVAYGVDISPLALDVAAENGALLGLTDRVTWLEGEGLAPVPEPVALIVSNPPYISAAEMAGLALDVREFEPHTALQGGEDGLDVYRSLIAKACGKLLSGGLLVLEIGYQQRAAVTALLEQQKWQDVSCYQDLAGRDRVIVAMRPL